MAKSKQKKHDDYQELFNENKELRKSLGEMTNSYERLKRNCTCQSKESEPFNVFPDLTPKQARKEARKKESIQETNSANLCPKCSTKLITASYSKMDVPWILIRCPNTENCDFRINKKVTDE